jgi:hypothetical protein
MHGHQGDVTAEAGSFDFQEERFFKRRNCGVVSVNRKNG